MTNSPDLFDLLGTDEELASEMAADKLAAAESAALELDALLAKAAAYYSRRAIEDATMARQASRRPHGERSRRYSRYD